MPRTFRTYLSITVIPVLFLAACVPQNKVHLTKEKLRQEDSLLNGYKNNLQNLDAIRTAKEQSNTIDDTANDRLKKFIGKTKKEIDTTIQKNTLLVNGNVVSRNDWKQLSNALANTQRSSTGIQEKLAFLEDLVNRNLVVKLDQDILFQSGSYSVSPDVIKNIGQLFEPAAKGIDAFTKKYPNFSLSLVITFKGYADGTIISPGSTLYNDLKNQLVLANVKDPDSKELNKELSRARAEAVKKLFAQFAATRKDNGIYSKNIVSLYEGKGEQFPDPTITDYKTNDPRRRVVLLYWSLFPD